VLFAIRKVPQTLMAAIRRRPFLLRFAGTAGG
jgi:hypothetical protein